MVDWALTNNYLPTYLSHIYLFRKHSGVVLAWSAFGFWQKTCFLHNAKNTWEWFWQKTCFSRNAKNTGEWFGQKTCFSRNAKNTGVVLAKKHASRLTRKTLEWFWQKTCFWRNAKNTGEWFWQKTCFSRNAKNTRKWFGQQQKPCFWRIAKNTGEWFWQGSHSGTVPGTSAGVDKSKWCVVITCPVLSQTRRQSDRG